MKTLYRIGQIVPSSNITMETEIPAMLQARQLIRPERFTFHSSRMRMNEVSKDELASMDGESDRCALELSDAQVVATADAYQRIKQPQGLDYGVKSTAQLRVRARRYPPWSNGASGVRRRSDDVAANTAAEQLCHSIRWAGDQRGQAG